MELGHIITELNETWVDMVPWSLESMNIEKNVFTGVYQIHNVAKHSNDPASKSILHGNVVYTIVTYHELVSLAHFILNRSAPCLAKMPQMNFAEIKERILIAKFDIAFKKPIFDSKITLLCHVDQVIDKYNSSRLYFFEVSTEVQQGRQSFVSSVCLNLRDNF